MRNTARLISALLLCGLLFGRMPHAAAADSGIKVESGDLNADGIADRADVILLQNLLLTVQDASFPDAQASDLNGDNCLNAADLTLLKRLLLEDHTKKMPAPPVRILEPSLPSVGSSRIPVFAVSFPDCSFPADAEEALEARCFSGAAQDDPLWPRESVSAYFDRASYGRMKLRGDVLPYTAKHPIDEYAADHAQSLAAEIAAAFEAQLDYQVYDADGDLRIDAFVIALPDQAIKIDSDGDGKPDWWPFSGASVSTKRFDGLRIGDYCAIVYDDRNPADFVGKAAHELCHAMGLPDYYRYTADASEEHDGMPGAAGCELMDEGSGDLSACSKLLLGWLAEDEVQIFSGGTQHFSLTSMQQSPSCVLIPRTQGAGFLSEYFLIEYVTQEGNNTAASGSGIRILHVQAEVSEGAHGMEFSYNNYGLHYDQSNEKQRVLRLVNDYGLFYPGTRSLQYTDRIDGSIVGFHWYDAEGNLTAETGLTLRIEGFQPGPDYEPDPISSLDPKNDPLYLRGSRYNLTISDETDGMIP